MDLKVNIGLLKGKMNWGIWNYKVNILLRSFLGGENVILGQINKPEEPEGDKPEEAVVRDFNNKLEFYQSAETKALLDLTTNMTEETLMKVMRFSSGREV